MGLPAGIVAILRSATLPVRQLGATSLAGSRLVRALPVATLAAAPFVRFGFSGEPHSTQNGTALFANVTRIDSVLCDQFVALRSR
jgi:hypothetical protein